MAYSTDILADSPVVYLRLNETSGTVASDSSGNSNNGTYVGTPTLGVTGLIASDTDTAVQVTGNQQITFPYTLSGVTFSMEIWWKWTADGTSTGVWRDNTAAGGTGYILSVQTNGVSIRIAGTDRLATATNYRDGIRHHFVVTYDGTMATFYADGVQIDTWAKSSATLPVTPMHVGYNGTNASQYQPGIYDEVALYGTVLSSASVAAHYTAAGSAPSSAQVEATYIETAVTGTSSAQVETSYIEAAVAGSSSAQIETSYLETMVMVEPVKVETVYAETLLTGTPPSQIEGVYAEAMLTTTPPSLIETVYVEALLLPVTFTRFVGWGVPI